MKPEPKLLLALESIPRVIGERQFRTLCEALEIDEEIFVIKDYGPSSSREDYFARQVQIKASRAIQRRKAEMAKPDRFSVGS